MWCLLIVLVCLLPGRVEGYPSKFVSSYGSTSCFYTQAMHDSNVLIMEKLPLMTTATNLDYCFVYDYDLFKDGFVAGKKYNLKVSVWDGESIAGASSGTIDGQNCNGTGGQGRMMPGQTIGWTAPPTGSGPVTFGRTCGTGHGADVHAYTAAVNERAATTRAAATTLAATSSTTSSSTTSSSTTSSTTASSRSLPAPTTRATTARTAATSSSAASSSRPPPPPTSAQTAAATTRTTAAPTTTSTAGKDDAVYAPYYIGFGVGTPLFCCAFVLMIVWIQREQAAEVSATELLM